MSIWDDIPEAQEVDLTTLEDDKKLALLQEYVDETKAANLVQAIGLSATDYENNMKRILATIDYINVALGGALRIAKIVA